MVLFRNFITHNYRDKCGMFFVHMDQENYEKIVCIETERFKAYPLYTKETMYENFSEDIQTLYRVTFGDAIVMKKYKYGLPKTKKEFEIFVQERSLCVFKNDPFIGFIIVDKKCGNVIGYEEIDTSNQKGIGEIAYIFDKTYHSSLNNQYKHVGYENIGALVWGYGAQLYKNIVLVNKINNQNKKNAEMIPFKGLLATVRIDNPASIHILRNLGFAAVTIIERFGYKRLLFKLNFDHF